MFGHMGHGSCTQTSPRVRYRDIYTGRLSLHLFHSFWTVALRRENLQALRSWHFSINSESPFMSKIKFLVTRSFVRLRTGSEPAGRVPIDSRGRDTAPTADAKRKDCDGK